MANGMKQGGSGSSGQLPDATIPPLKKSGGGTATIPTGPPVSVQGRTVPVVGSATGTSPPTPPPSSYVPTNFNPARTAGQIIRDLQRLKAEQQKDEAQDQVLMDYLNRETTSPKKEDPMTFKAGGATKREDKGIPKK